MANIFKALSVLLTYPTGELQEAAGAISETLDHEPAVPARVRAQLHDLIEEIASDDLYDLQERYVLLFDRTRSLSLHLFEHVHGESRDRGQAMVDLQNLYAEGGLEIGAAELPDFSPLFLEFLATQPKAKAHDLLGQPVHVFSALAERLRKRKSSYEAVFRALAALAAAKPKNEEIASLLGEPDPDADDLAALDAAWEDAPVRFGPGTGDGCKDDLAIKLRAARRPAPGVAAPAPQRPIITHSRASAEPAAQSHPASLPPCGGGWRDLHLGDTGRAEREPGEPKCLVAPGGRSADSVDPPSAHVSLASPALRAGALGNARDLPHKGGGEGNSASPAIAPPEEGVRHA